jgi:hypothetical protein
MGPKSIAKFTIGVNVPINLGFDAEVAEKFLNSTYWEEIMYALHLLIFEKFRRKKTQSID